MKSKKGTDGQTAPVNKRVKRQRKTQGKLSGKKVSEPEIIFSDTSKEAAQTDDKNIFSSSEALEKNKLSKVRKEIEKFETRHGEDVPAEEEETRVVPIVINKTALSDIIELSGDDDKSNKPRTVKTTKTTKERADKNGAIPSRHINYAVSLQSGKRLEYKNTVRRDSEVHRSASVETVVDNESEPVDSDLLIPGETAEAKTMEIKLTGKMQTKKAETADDDIVTEEKTAEIKLTKDIGTDEGEVIAEDKTVEIKLPKDIPNDSPKKKRKRKKKPKAVPAADTVDTVITDGESADEPVAENIVRTMVETIDEPVIDNTVEPVVENTVENTDEIVVEKIDEPAAETTDEPAAEITDEPVAETTDEPVVENTDETVVENADEPVAEPIEETTEETTEETAERVIGARQIPHVADEIAGKPKNKKKKKKKKTENDGSENKKQTKKRSNKKSGKTAVTFDDDDIAENSTVAALSYLGLLMILPIMKQDESPFCRAHVKQGIRVFVYSIIVMLATLAVILGLRALIVWVLGWSFVIYKVLQFAVTAVMVILVVIPSFHGAVGAFSGEYRKVPFVGKDAVKKNK